MFAQQGFLLSDWHTCSSSGFKGHTGAIFCDTRLTENGTLFCFAIAFYKQTSKGSVYVEFDVPTSSLRQTKDIWATIPGPDSIYSKLAEKKGEPPITSFPKAINIKKIGVKE